MTILISARALGGKSYARRRWVGAPIAVTALLAAAAPASAAGESFLYRHDPTVQTLRPQHDHARQHAGRVRHRHLTATDKFSATRDVTPIASPEEARTLAPPLDLAPGETKAPVDPFRDTSGAVAILALDETKGGPEYQMLQTIGVPSTVVGSVDEAVGYRFVIVAATMTADTLDQTDADKLLAYAKDGGHVLLEASTSYRFRDALGYTSAIESTKRNTLTFMTGLGSLLDANGIDGPDRIVALDDPSQDAGVGTVGYDLPPVPAGDGSGDNGSVLAHWDDGTAALMGRGYGAGWVATVGARFIDLVTRHWEGARYSPTRGYVNQSGTDADVWMLLLRVLYRESNTAGLTLATSPDGSQAAVLPTISANWSDGLLNTPRYVQTVAKAGSPTTVYVDTHTTTDWLDSGFFPTPKDSLDGLFGKTASALWAIQDAGGQIASETVAHSTIFNRLADGTGAEDWSNYSPFVVNRHVTKGATVSGEVRVSRELLGQFTKDTSSFRAGYLLTPRHLPQALDAAGYQFDSSTTQGWVQGAFPFHVPRFDDQGFANVLEFPITIEDEAKPAFASRIDAAETTILANAQNGAPSTILVHPNRSGEKMRAYGKLINDLRGKMKDALWFGTVGDFGRFWSQRDNLTLGTYPDAASCTGGVVFVVYNRGSEDASNQGIETGGGRLGDKGVTYDHAIINGETVPVNAYGKVVLPTIAGGDAIKGELCPPTLPDLAGSWYMRDDLTDGATTLDVQKTGGDATSAYYLASGPAGEQIGIYVSQGMACVTQDDNDTRQMQPWMCGQIDVDGTTIGPLSWTGSDGAQHAVTFSRTDAPGVA